MSTTQHREYTTLPNFSFSSMSDHPLLRVGGPDYINPNVIFNPRGDELFAAKSISPFPARKDGSRLHDPISDRFYSSIYEDKVLFAIAQSKGDNAALASELCILGFVEYMTQMLHEDIRTTQDAAQKLQRAFAKAHDRVIKKEGIKSTTELLGGIFGRLDDGGNNDWAIVACSVGHCKAFTLHVSDCSVVDITQNNYLYNYSAPKGALGPVLGNAPNLDNMSLYCHICQPGDLVVFTTQGIHKNFHPQFLGMSPADLKMEAASWEELASDQDKALLSEFITKKMKESCALSKNSEPNTVIQQLLISAFDATAAGRKFLMKDPESTEKDLPVTIPCAMDFSSAFALKGKAMGSPSDFIPPTDEFNKEKHEDRLHVWEWNAIIHTKKDAKQFDLFAFLVEKNPEMEEVIASSRTVEIEECYLNLSDPDIEVRQRTPMILDIRYRTASSSVSRIEKWDFLGEVNLENMKGSGKNSLLTCVSNLLRRKGVGVKAATRVASELSGIDVSKDIVVVKGIKRTIPSLEKLGGKLQLAGADVSVSQCNVELFTIDNPTASVFSTLEIRSKKESSLQLFNQEIASEFDDQWTVCAFPEFLVSLREQSE